MDFNKPGPNKRVCAFFIDSIIGQIFGVLFSIALAKDISWIIWAVYILFKDCISGQSVGKYIVGTQVVDEDNLPAKYFNTIIRNIFMIIPLLPLIEYIVMLRDKEEARRIGDKIAKTKVNDLKPQAQDSTFLWISVALLIVVAAIKIGTVFIFIKQHPVLIK